jgi:V/A-type H+-transporting ATPase subunit D
MATISLLRVPPTRSALLGLQRRRATLQVACALLERKRQVLAQKVVELLPRWEKLRQQTYPQLAAAYRSFAVTRMRSTAEELRQLAGGVSPLLRAELLRQVLSGVPTFTASAEAEPLRPRFGLLGSTAELDRTIVLLRDAAAALARLAALEATLRSLARTLEKTNRQVRTLRDRLLPHYDATIRHIVDTLEEQERSYLFQLKRLR